MNYYLVPRVAIKKLKVIERNLRKNLDEASLKKCRLALEVLQRIANDPYWTATYHPTIEIGEESWK